MAFSENLKLMRERRSLSQAELANMAGVSQAMIAQYEMGIKVPTVIVAVNIEKALNTTCRELVEGKEVKVS